ncbi:MAG: hypothetical protein ACTSPN_07725 [Promethearchaeota archaeon]
MASTVKEIHYTIHRNMVLLLIATTILLILSRILIMYFDFSFLIEFSRDNDFRNLVKWNQNGLVNYPPYYLYFWILRLIVTSYVAYKVFFMITDRIDLLMIYLLIYIGFINDGWYNNCNFVIMLFYFLSYKYLGKDNKWASGIFFALSTLKINSIIYLPVLLIMKKIKLKEVYYYLIPFGLLLLPYIIFPDYTILLFTNWTKGTPGIGDSTPVLNAVNTILSKVAQPSQFLYFSIILMIILQSIKKYKRHTQIRKTMFALIAIFYTYVVIFTWLIPLFTYHIWL